MYSVHKNLDRTTVCMNNGIKSVTINNNDKNF